MNNSLSVNSFNAFKTEFKKLLHQNSFERIIFLEQAFKNQNQLFFAEKFEYISEMIDTNINNYLKFTHFLLPFMLKIKSGKFIYLSSFRSQETSKGTSIYSSSKAFGEKFFEIIGKEYGSKGIYATSIRMGYFDGKMLEKMDPKISNNLMFKIGNRRLGNSIDLYETLEYIIRNDYTNGGIIELTGGINYN